MVSKKYYKKPAGFINFTDISMKKRMEKSGYIVRIGRNPYTVRGGKVLFYKRKIK